MQNRNVASPINKINMRDPRYGRVHGGSIGARRPQELNRLTAASPFFASFGTHRSIYGEALLDPLRRLDVKESVKLFERGLQWRSTPGPGTYRTPVTVGQGFERRSKTPLDCLYLTSVSHIAPPNPGFARAARSTRSRCQTPGSGHHMPTCGYSSI